jgi:hypothetical protein
MRALLLIGLLFLCGQTQASPCGSVSRELSDVQKAAWSTAIAKQLGAQTVSVRQAFALRDWKIVYVETPNSDPPFLFFHGSPGNTRYVTIWSGAARAEDKGEIRSWVMNHAPGIPGDLASCFAWHVSKARDQ